MLYHILNYVQPFIKIPACNDEMINSMVKGCEGIYMAACCVYLFCNLADLAPCSAFEEHVFKYMGDTCDIFFLISSANPYPHLKCSNRRRMIFIKYNRHAVFKCGFDGFGIKAVRSYE